MKKLLVASAITILAISFAGCGCNSSSERNQVTVQPAPAAVQSPGFNVQNFAELVKKTSDPSSIEKAINDPGNAVNNLDINADGKVDFLSVNETANTIQVMDNDVNPATQICTLNITQAGQQANVAINGSPTYCGNNYAYHSSFSMTDFLLLHYMLTPHRYYYPHYSYGYHPAYYRSYRPASYRTVTRSYSSPGYRSSTPTSTYRSSTPSRSSISSPSSSQRSFSTTPRNTGSFRSTGFGSSSSRPSSSFRSSSSSSSRSSFGSSRSSFGGGRRH